MHGRDGRPGRRRGPDISRLVVTGPLGPVCLWSRRSWRLGRTAASRREIRVFRRRFMGLRND